MTDQIDIRTLPDIPKGDLDLLIENSAPTYFANLAGKPWSFGAGGDVMLETANGPIPLVITSPKLQIWSAAVGALGTFGEDNYGMYRSKSLLEAKVGVEVGEILPTNVDEGDDPKMVDTARIFVDWYARLEVMLAEAWKADQPKSSIVKEDICRKTKQVYSQPARAVTFEQTLFRRGPSKKRKNVDVGSVPSMVAASMYVDTEDIEDLSRGAIEDLAEILRNKKQNRFVVRGANNEFVAEIDRNSLVAVRYGMRATDHAYGVSAIPSLDTVKVVREEVFGDPPAPDFGF